MVLQQVTSNEVKRKKYSAPVFQEFGDLAELTKGGTSSGPDGDMTGSEGMG